ncbi:DeoR/GlpR family DNA-binding transcription regulator [Terribacillus saccharophilus]|uniref:DeoR/GlpR family DNA-binding transcription regulator n=1 Tax=Terribacillus saccharophilus TaxID=361277 RepID=UPI000C9A2018|nr:MULTISPECIES: DeoR/GlpR family DNA-binding transcription regulator [Terribacillus]MCM3226957.1 DeoR/GlpR family DNA-binding transcription regulator [Terribacillus saccharophilus]
MLKRERLLKIVDIVNKQGIITVNDIIHELNVSDMTIRRDLDELDKAGKLVRIHGGAQSITHAMDQELSHVEKLDVQVEEKTQIASLAASIVSDRDTVFLGPGTTIELLARHLLHKKIRIITNSYPVFEILTQSDTAEIMLIGGDFRKNTGTFVGPLVNSSLQKLNFTKAFISANGVHNEEISTYSIEEGEAHQIALNNSRSKYLLVDHTKFNREDFYVFYNLHDMDYLLTDDKIRSDVQAHYEQYVELQLPKQA